MKCRWFFDITYTRTRKDVTGITRTVRRLLEELQNLARLDGWSCDPVIFHSTGFRFLKETINAKPVTKHFSIKNNLRSQSLVWITTQTTRWLVMVAIHIFPWIFLKKLWGFFSSRIFNIQSSACLPVQFRQGDVLFIADASWNYCSWKAARLARSQGARVVTLVYDLMPLRRPEFCFALLPLQFRTWLQEMLACSDAIICISKTTHNDLRTWISEQRDVSVTPAPPIAHFRLGSDPLDEPSQETVRPFIRNFLDGDEPCFAAIGSFEPKRNYSLILRVFERMWQRGVEVRLLLAGRQTNECAKFIEYLQSHPEHGKRLQTVHDASDAEILHIYQSCRALLMPSSFEGFGLPLVEARMRGCIVIASNIPAFIELADEGVFIFDITSDSSLESLLNQHLRKNWRLQINPMPPTLWKDSAAECLNTIDHLLSYSCKS